jgi:hypothetical protein
LSDPVHEPKTWRVLLDGKGAATPPLRADEIASRLWSGGYELLWAEPSQPGDPAFPAEVPEVRAILFSEPVRVARAALRHPNADAAEWMFLWVVEMLQEYPDEAWPVLLSLIDVARDDKELALVAAGPLEELLVAHGLHVIDRVEEQAARNGRFRRALSGVWRREIGDEVWGRVVKARGTEPGLDG